VGEVVYGPKYAGDTSTRAGSAATPTSVMNSHSSMLREVRAAGPPLAAEAAGAAQQTLPEPAGCGSTKKDKEKLRKERQRQRKVEEAWEALQGAVELFLEAAGSVDAVEVAMQAAEKYEARSEKLAALVAEKRELIKQARAAEAARARVAAEVAEAAAAVEEAAKAVARLQRLQSGCGWRSRLHSR
jgi:DNA repair exonuclease SbcCD ATPase subunit